MAQKTVEVGDTEVQITETDDGFEVTEVDEIPDGFYVRASTHSYGFIIPLSDSDEFDVTRKGSSTAVAWNTDVDVSDLHSDGWGEAQKDGFDGYASVSSVEIIERRGGEWVDK